MAATEELHSTLEIAPHGDVIFTIGPEKRMIRVCSSVLQNASPYFKSLFGPHFSEGQDLDSHNPKEIPLPEDDADALEILLKVIHLRNDTVPSTLEPNKVIDVVIAADKFDCILAIKHIGSVWSNPQGVKDTEVLARLMAVAYMLDDVETFRKVTSKMINHHEGSYLSLAHEDLGLPQDVLLTILCMLEEARNHKRMKVEQVLFQGALSAGHDHGRSCGCDFSAKYGHNISQQRQDGAFQPRNNGYRSVSSILQSIQRIKEPPMSAWTYACRTADVHDIHSYFAFKLEKIRNIPSMCIDCVKSKVSGEKRACRQLN